MNLIAECEILCSLFRHLKVRLWVFSYFLTNVRRTILYSQTGGVRAMAFNGDGRSIFCGLHESMKVRFFGRKFVFF